MTTNMNGPMVVLKLPKQPEQVSTYARSVQTALTGNAYFPNAPLGTLAADIAALDLAQAGAAARTKGSAKARDAKLRRVVHDLQHLRDYVQGVVEEEVDPVTARAMIESAGMCVRRQGTRTKALLRAVQLDALGNVGLTAKAVAKKATYYWQYSAAGDPKTWMNVTETMRATTTIGGLTLGQVYAFRFRALTPQGFGEWSQPVILRLGE